MILANGHRDIFDAAKLYDDLHPLDLSLNDEKDILWSAKTPTSSFKM